MTFLKSDLSQPIQNSSANPFHWEPFRRCWFEHMTQKMGVQAEYRNFVVYRKRMVKGLLTLKELKFYASAQGWFHDFTPSQLEDFQAIQGKLDWDYFYTVWAGSREHLQAFDGLKAAGYPVAEGFTKPMYVVDLSDGYEAYLACKSSNYRYQMRRKLKKVQSMQPHLIRYERFEEIETFFQEFFKHHISYWQQKAGHSFFSDPNEQAFNIAWAKELHQAGKLWLQGLVFNDEMVNLSVSFVEEDTLYWPLMINTGKHLEALPGIISLYLRIQDAAEQGIQTYNMGYGDFDYKMQAATHQEARNVVVAANPKSLKGRLFAQWIGYKSSRGIRLH